MAEPARKPMTVDEFLAWQADRARGPRYELVAGEPIAMAPERAGHVRVKTSAFLALETAIRQAGLDCEALADGMTVRIDEISAYEPDALVRCGPRLSDDEAEAPDPIVVVEVLSPGTEQIDSGAKLADYFRLPSVMHYLVVAVDRRLVVHHARRPGGGGAIDTRIVDAGDFALDPPGLTLDLEAFYTR
jgi:Uma2 family endonuclease